MKIILWHSCQGSPPHRRGKVGLDGGLSEAVGITPAQAGKSKLALCTPSCPTDHPCAGGEKNKELEGVWLPMGSPPRGRGKVLYRVPEVVPVRITPAWAGKSQSKLRGSASRKDHPRVGGEKGEKGGRSHEQQGSPPRGRGKAHKLIKQRHVAGITPAWAGKRFCKEIAPPSVEDHPRVGGEKVRDTKAGSHAQGSPPRGRGKAAKPLPCSGCAGITPAWAGKSDYAAFAF